MNFPQFFLIRYYFNNIKILVKSYHIFTLFVIFKLTFYRAEIFHLAKIFFSWSHFLHSYWTLKYKLIKLKHLNEFLNLTNTHSLPGLVNDDLPYATILLNYGNLIFVLPSDHCTKFAVLFCKNTIGTQYKLIAYAFNRKDFFLL